MIQNLVSIIAASRRRQFDPLSLSPALWLDASDANTLFDAVSGGNLVAPDGAIARWQDKSGNARHVTQQDIARRPSRRISIKNGKDICRFDGLDFLRSSAFSLPQPFTLVAVAGGGVYTNFSRNLLAGVGAGSTPTIAVTSSSNLIGYAGSTITSSIPITSSFIGIFQANGSASTLFQNGSSVSSGNAGSGTLSGATVGAWGSSENNSGFIGDIYECFIFPYILSTTNRQAVENYLNAKWAIY